MCEEYAVHGLLRSPALPPEVIGWQADWGAHDLAAAGCGTGLQGMANLLEGLGGDVQLTSAVGRGATVSGRIPVEVSS